MASWQRFFFDFGRFWEASWEGNRSQDRPKKASKNDAKQKSNEIAKKVAIRLPTDSRHPGSWVLGRSPPKGLANPSPPGREITDRHFFPFNPCLPLPFPSLPLSSPVLACLGLSWLDFPPQLGPKLVSKIHPNPEKMESRRPSYLDFVF